MPLDEKLEPSFETSSEAFLERYLPGNSAAIVELRRRLAQLNSQRSIGLVRVVLLLGESGAGKNYLARVLAGHRRWLEIRHNRSENPGVDAGLDAFTDYFEEIELPALPGTLVESALFGYRKGAFTGAQEDRPGLLGGPMVGKSRRQEPKEYKDILLDEIGDASPELQAKLLRVIQDGQCRPVGGGPDDTYRTSARLILATNHDLDELVTRKLFRQDLYWRAREIVLEVPALRQQPENIESIARQIEADLLSRIPENIEKENARLTDEDLRWAKTYAHCR